ncbi:MAG: ABC transporter substrate-binding protein [Deltaproteobacteria bacterium]|nr:ABC transporter substrate-binding protein [Deltaproteobacteria bacterium]
MISRLTLAVLLAILGAMLVSLPCVGGSNRGLVKRKLVRLSKILNEENPQKRTLRLMTELHQTFDYGAFEQKVLQDAGAKMTPSQRQRFSTVFRTLFEQKILALASDESLYCEQYTVSEGERESDVLVRCEKRANTDYIILHFNSTKSKLVEDLSLGDTLLSRNYRGVINKTLRKEGVEALIAKIAAKTDGPVDGTSLF